MASHLSHHGHEVRYALRDSDPQLADKPAREKAKLCYLWDRAMVEWAEVVIGEASYPSTGLGIELQISSHKGTPIVLCFDKSIRFRAAKVRYENPDDSQHDLQIGEGYITLMALGLPSIFKVLPYTSTGELLQSLLDQIRVLQNRVTPEAEQLNT